MTAITTTYTTFHLPKHGETELAYEDNYAPQTPHTKKQTATPTRFSISDGVTKAAYSGRWAGLLTESYVQNGADALQLEHLRNLASVWQEKEIKILYELGSVHDESGLANKKREIRHRGASATFNGLELIPETKHFLSINIGDSCLFQIRDGTIISQNPELTPDLFTNKPSQISTIRLEDPHWKIDTKEGTFLDGDIFILATDCTSKWLLTTDIVSTEEKIQKILSIKTQDEFEKLIETERAAERMGNDDMTISIIRIE